MSQRDTTIGVDARVTPLDPPGDAAAGASQTPDVARPFQRERCFASQQRSSVLIAARGGVPLAGGRSLVETTIGLFTTEKIHREGRWRSLSEVEPAPLEWDDWYNSERTVPPGAGVLPLKWNEHISNN